MVDVAFSQDRFLQKVLDQAKAGVNAAAVERLKAMGFTEEMSRMALHVSCSNEQRALELCMSGFTFMGADELASAVWTGKDPSAPLSQRMPSKGSKCYVCGQNFITPKSLDIHLKSCKKKFDERERKKPECQRRQLLDEAELPEQFASLEEYYLQLEESRCLESASLAESAWQGAGHEILSRRAIDVPKPPTVQGDLLPCEHCKRTFRSDRLEVHRKVCLQRPKEDAPPPPPSRRRCSNGGTGASVVQKAYGDFCNQLKQCEGCSRRFTAEVLEKHRAVCEKLLEAAAARRHAASVFASRRSRTDQAASMKRMSEARSNMAAATSAPPSSFGKPLGRGAATTSTAPTCKNPTSTAVRRASFGGVAAKGGGSFAPPARRQSLPEKRVAHGEAQPEELPSAATLQEKGYLTPLDDTSFEASLRMQLQERLPSAEFVGAYKVQSWHSNLYDAMRTTMIQQKNKKKTQGAQDQGSKEAKKRQPEQQIEVVADAPADAEDAAEDAEDAEEDAAQVSSFGGGSSSSSSSSEGCSAGESSEAIAADVERELWHGTSWKTVPKILKHGFNRSFAGQHGTLLGIATYFSSNLAYSHRFCDRNGGGKDGTKAVLLSRVLVGRYCKGDPNDVEPPSLRGGDDDDERFDSTVDCEEKPSIFAVFRDFQAVPLVLLEFRVPPR